MAACPNCARPLAASADCAACGQEQPPASDALLTPGPAASLDRRRTLLALSLLLLIASAIFVVDLEGPVLWLICVVVAAMTLWCARTEPPRLRWGQNLERSAVRRDRAWMVFATALCNLGVAGAIYRSLLWGASDGFWSSGLGGLINAYHFLSYFLGGAGATVGLASIVWRLDVAARRRGRAPNRWRARFAIAAFLLAVIINLAVTIMLLEPPAFFIAFGAHPILVIMDYAEIIGLVLAGLFLIGSMVILSLLPAAMRSSR